MKTLIVPSVSPTPRTNGTRDASIDTFLHKVRGQMQQAVAEAQGDILEACLHIVQSPSKMLRPTLVFWSAQTVTAPPSNGIHSGEISALVDFAAAAELIHAASLIHDDVIDKAAERRRRPSANKLFGNHTAVLAGDYMFASAFELLTAHASLGVIPLMTEAIRQMCLGEMAQKQRLYDATLCEDAYFQRIQHKTASLLAACAEGGVLVAGGSPEQARQFQRYGVKLGMAYQIADDIIDFESTDETAGKPTGQDIVNGIYTLPLLRMPDREHWMQRLRRGGDVAADITALRQALHDCGALVSAKQTAKQLAQEAADAIVDYTGQRHPLLQWCQLAVSRLH